MNHEDRARSEDRIKLALCNIDSIDLDFVATLIESVPGYRDKIAVYRASYAFELLFHLPDNLIRSVAEVGRAIVNDSPF